MQNLDPSQKLHIPHHLFLVDYQIKDSKHFLKLETGRHSYRLSLETDAFETLLQFVKPSTPIAAAKQLKVSLEFVLSICIELFKKNLLSHSFSANAHSRYNRHLLYYSLNSLNPIESQEKLKKMTVTLIGMGGIGNWLSLNLIGLGLKKIRMVDPDTIEETNLTRQVLFKEKDIGKNKVLVAREELRKRNRETEIEVFRKKVSRENLKKLVEGSDFAVLSADFPPYLIQKWMNEACLYHKIPFFNVGYSGGIGVLGPLVVPGKTACLACYQNRSQSRFKGKIQLIAENYQTPSFVCLNSTISSLAAYEIVKYLLSFGNLESLGCQLQFDPLNLGFKKIPVKKNKTCKECQHTEIV